jgi:hypothetical protein
MKTFRIVITQNQFIVAGGAGVGLRTWGPIGQYFWSLDLTPANNTSLFTIEGFKSVNIYGIEVNGFVRGNPASTRCAVVEDWGFGLQVLGTSPLISGIKRTSPDGFAIGTTGNSLTTYFLSKNTNSVFLNEPIANVKSIEFNDLYAQGSGAEFLNEIALSYLLNFTFHYTYEGED